MKQYTITIEGMGCENCVRSVEGALSNAGAAVQRVQLGMAEVQFDGDAAVLKAAIEDVGFDVTGLAQA